MLPDRLLGMGSQVRLNAKCGKFIFYDDKNLQIQLQLIRLIFHELLIKYFIMLIKGLKDI